MVRMPPPPPPLPVIREPAWELGAMKAGQVVEQQIHGGEDERVKSLAL